MAVASWILEAIGVALCLLFSVMYSSEKMRAQTYIFSVSLAILLVVIGVLLRS
jgi:K+ transporter